MVAVDDRQLGDDVERIVAATGRALIRAAGIESVGRQAWTRAAAVVLDDDAATIERAASLPRRSRVVLVGYTEPSVQTWRQAVAVGAEGVLTLPADEAQLVTVLGGGTSVSHRGGVVAVVGGRGGAGASVFAAALALTASGGVLVVDADPYGGGLDLLFGWEGVDGLRWSDIDLRSGRVDFDAMRRALPSQRGVTLLSSSRAGRVGGGEAMGAVIDSARDAGVPVIADLPRRISAAATAVLERADLVVVVAPAEVRACASSVLVAAAVQAVSPNVGLVVRGPAPGGLRAEDVAAMVGVPLLAAMRPEPNIGARLDADGLRLSRRSPLAQAARRVLALLPRAQWSSAA